MFNKSLSACFSHWYLFRGASVDLHVNISTMARMLTVSLCRIALPMASVFAEAKWKSGGDKADQLLRGCGGERHEDQISWRWKATENIALTPAFTRLWRVMMQSHHL